MPKLRFQIPVTISSFEPSSFKFTDSPDSINLKSVLVLSVKNKSGSDNIVTGTVKNSQEVKSSTTSLTYTFDSNVESDAEQGQTTVNAYLGEHLFYAHTNDDDELTPEQIDQIVNGLRSKIQNDKLTYTKLASVSKPSFTGDDGMYQYVASLAIKVNNNTEGAVSYTDDNQTGERSINVNANAISVTDGTVSANIGTGQFVESTS
tara:strand:+ start:119 stop:733 length:615 start_codon:yes stop_codon:yes gene_type:complete